MGTRRNRTGMAIAGGVCCHLGICLRSWSASCRAGEVVEKGAGDESCLGWGRVLRTVGRMHVRTAPNSDEDDGALIVTLRMAGGWATVTLTLTGASLLAPT